MVLMECTHQNELNIDGHVWAMSSERERKLGMIMTPSGAIPPLSPHPFFTQQYTQDEQLLLFTNNVSVLYILNVVLKE